MWIAKFCALIVSFVFVMTSWADANTGLKFCWRADVDLNGDGLLQANEFRDYMTFSAETPLMASEVVQCTESASYEVQPIAFETGVDFPAQRRSDATVKCIHIYNPTNYDASGNIVIDRQNIKLPAAASVGGNAGTFYMRFKWDGRRFVHSTQKNYTYFVSMYENDYNYNSKRGWRVGLHVYDSGTANNMYPSFYIGDGEVRMNAINSSNNRVQSGFWYEMAVTFSRDENNLVTATSYLQKMDTKDPYVSSKTGSLSGTIRPAGTGIATIGSGGAGGFAGQGSGDDSFRGCIHEIRIYDRALTQEECFQIFDGTDGLWQVGVKNGSAAELSDTDAVEVYEPATMPWYRCRKTLTEANPSVSVKCDVPANYINVARVLQIRPVAGAPNGARLQVNVNGRKVGDKVVPQDGSDMFVFLSAENMAKLDYDDASKSYPMTVTLTRVNELSGNVQIDYMSLGGSWQLGTHGGVTGEFGSSGCDEYRGYCYYLGTADIKHMCGAFGYGGGYVSQTVWFPMSDEEAANYDHVLIVDGYSYGPCKIYLNGTTDDAMIADWDNESFYSGSSHPLSISKGTLKGGLNRLYLLGASNGTWSNLDFIRLNVINNGGKNRDPGYGMMLLCR